MSATINQINKILKKKKENINFVSILLGFDIITDIDMYGTITIPFALLLNKLSINRDTIGLKGKDTIQKKLLINAVPTITISELLTYINIPKEISIPIISLVLDLFNCNVKDEFKMMTTNSIAFSGAKFSETKKILQRMEFERIILNIFILLIINHIGFNMSASLILVRIISELSQQIYCDYKIRHQKGFLK